MKKLFFILLALCLTTITRAQQEVTIKTFKELMSDLSARTSRRYDLNDEACALIKVQYPKPGATFEGSIVGDAEYRNGEYWVYVSKGTKRFRIHLPEVPTIVVEFADYGIQQAESNVTYSIDFRFPSNGLRTSVYVEAGMLAGSIMGPELSLGTYIGGFNAEVFALLPLMKEEYMYWYNDNQYPVRFGYKPSYCLGGRIGYGIMIGKHIRITPQAGVRYLQLKETAQESTTLAPANKANRLSVVVDCKLQYMITKHIGISVMPEYCIPVSKSKGYSAIANASSKITKWNKGIGGKLSVNVEF